MLVIDRDREPDVPNLQLIQEDQGQQPVMPFNMWIPTIRLITIHLPTHQQPQVTNEHNKVGVC